MRSSVRLIAVAAGALLLAGCGVEAGDGAATATTTTTEALDPLQEQTRQLLEDTYRDLGFTPEESACLADALSGTIVPGEAPDATASMDALNECGLDAERLLEFSEELGGTSMEDGMKAGIEASLGNLGLTDEQAACVADSFIDEFGTDTGSMGDPSQFEQFFEQCGVTLPGGD